MIDDQAAKSAPAHRHSPKINPVRPASAQPTREWIISKVTILAELKKIRRSRWSKLHLLLDLPKLADALGGPRGLADARAALAIAINDAEPSLQVEPALERYASSTVKVLHALLGLGDTTSEASTEERYKVAAEIAHVSLASLRTRDSNLLLDAAARVVMRQAIISGAKNRNIDALTPQQTTVSDLEREAMHTLKRISPKYGSIAWSEGSKPILTIESDPSRIREYLSYTAGIEHRRIGSISVYQISSSFRCTRIAPSTWRTGLAVAFCRSIDELERQFQEPAVASVELCDVDYRIWHRLFPEIINSNVFISGEKCEKVGHEIRDNVIILYFKPTKYSRWLLNTNVPVAIHNTYVVPGSTRSYPIKIGTYYCRRAVEMSVTLIDSRAESLDVYLYLVKAPTVSNGPANNNDVEIERFLKPDGTRQQTVRVRTPDQGLLWPGSGVDFVWRRR